jgi:hypothetical protein
VDGFFTNYYIAQAGGQETCIAENWGWKRDDTAVDLDGDGVKELVCNVEYDTDDPSGLVVCRVVVYRLAADGSVECADPLELLDVPYRDDQGIGSLCEVYNAVHNTVDISMGRTVSAVRPALFLTQRVGVAEALLIRLKPHQAARFIKRCGYQNGKWPIADIARRYDGLCQEPKEVRKKRGVHGLIECL